MQTFHNMVWVGHGTGDETDALKHALSLARNNKAALGGVIACPEFPKEMADYKGKYADSLIEQLQKSILVMGTVVRTGIHSFVSPVKAY